jgi:hypothetical protein
LFSCDYTHSPVSRGAPIGRQAQSSPPILSAHFGLRCPSMHISTQIEHHAPATFPFSAFCFSLTRRYNFTDFLYLHYFQSYRRMTYCLCRALTTKSKDCNFIYRYGYPLDTLWAQFFTHGYMYLICKVTICKITGWEYVMCTRVYPNPTPLGRCNMELATTPLTFIFSLSNGKGWKEMR